MRPLAAADIHGTWAAPLLPIQPDDTVDFDRLEHEIDVLVGSGVAGLYSNGTAGEFYTLADDEWDRIGLLLAERCEAADIPFQIGACYTDPRVQLARVRRAATLRPGAIQVILPDWWPVTLDEAIACLERLAEAATPVPLVLYNPPHAKRCLDPRELACVAARVPAVVGMKVVDGDERWYEEMSALLSRLSVFVPGHRLATGVSRGAAGSYSNVACLHPRGAARWNALIARDSIAARDVERRINEFLAEHIAPFMRSGYSNPALDKLLAAIGDWSAIGTRLRWPYRSIPEPEALRLRAIARECMPEILQ